MTRNHWSGRNYTEVLTRKGLVQRSPKPGERFVTVRRREYPDASGGTAVTFTVTGDATDVMEYHAEGLPTAKLASRQDNDDGTVTLTLTWQY